MFDHWDSGQATVIDVMDITGNSSGTTRRHAYVLEAVAADGHEAFRDEDKDPLIVRDDFLAPRSGEVVAVKIDWDKKKIELIRDVPERKFNPYANVHKAKDNFAAELAGTSAPAAAPAAPGASPAATPAPMPAAAANNVGGVAAQLATLAALHEQGVLNDTQFEQAKNAAIGLSSSGS